MKTNSAMIKICQHGRNPTMRHLGRTHGIPVSLLNELLQKPGMDLLQEPALTMCADIFTKGFKDKHSWNRVCNLINCSDLSNANFVECTGLRDGHVIQYPPSRPADLSPVGPLMKKTKKKTKRSSSRSTSSSGSETVSLIVSRLIVLRLCPSMSSLTFKDELAERQDVPDVCKRSLPPVRGFRSSSFWSSAET